MSWARLPPYTNRVATELEPELLSWVRENSLKSTSTAVLAPRAGEHALDAVPELRPRFRLSTLFLGVTSCAVCLGVARSFPELAVAMVFVMAIAMIRVLYGIQLYSNSNVKLVFAREIWLYVLSLLVVIAIGGFVVCAFVTTLGACVGFGILIAQNAETRQTEWIFGGFITGWILGLIAGLMTAGWVTRLLWFENLLPPASSSKPG
jgi:hypothetical protein